MQQPATFIGIDISKLTLDICILQPTAKKHHCIDNEPHAISSFFSALMTQHPNLYIGMENTGCYNLNLYQVLNELRMHYYVIPPIHLKRSLGLTRGKNDKVDAMRIARFLELNVATLCTYKPQRPVIAKLQLLLTLRSQRVKIRKQLLANREQYRFMADDAYGPQALDHELISAIEAQIKAIEQQIQDLIQKDVILTATYKLISSVQGVGKILSWNLLVKTGEFSNITNPRKMACYAGVAPFEHSSGTSIRGRNKVSHYADKGLKMLLHLAAMSAIRLTGDLRDYYQRKVAEGKNKMSVLNAVRNKIIHRVFAVLKNGQPYQKYLNNNLGMS